MIIVVELLEQRQENAAALKLKSDRVGGMPEGEVTQLRSEIKVRQNSQLVAAVSR